MMTNNAYTKGHDVTCTSHLPTMECDPKLDPSTFVFPGHSGRTSITIEFCDKVHLLKSSEIVLKYSPVSLVSTIMDQQVTSIV